MPEVKKHTPGSFCWVELGTTDAAGAKEFYHGLFGWEFDDQSVSEDMVYTMIKLKKRDVAATYELTEEMREQGIPAHWLSYISVVDVEETVKKADELGGEILQEPFDVFEAGRMAMIEDPTGAIFALWQPLEHIGAKIVGEEGCLCWNELATNDVDAAGEFYSGLFGWEKKTQKLGEMEYTSFLNGDCAAGGMYHLGEDMEDVPAHWMAYFSVGDCDKTADNAESNGATIINPPSEIPGVGRFAVILDPQGGLFAFIKLETPGAGKDNG